jgi:hypothetical protein
MNPETRKLINWWLVRGRDERDPFVKMFIMYMCLDAWMTTGSGQDGDTAKREWLKNTENPLRDHWPTTPNKKVPLNGLFKVGKVEDMRPKYRGSYKYLTDTDNFDEAIEFIYQIRCNLFHGGKSYINTNDRNLCRWSATILQNWIEWTLIKTK